MADPFDPFDDEPTHVDKSLAETTPHRSLDWLAGRDEAFPEDVDAAIASIDRILMADGWTDEEVARWCLRLRGAANSRA